MQKRIFILILVFAVAVFCRAETVRDVARAAGKGTMVLAYGSDWSASGRKIRDVFRSAAFRDAVSSRYVLGEVDVRDTPTKESEAANKWAAPGNLESFRLPALFLCAKDGHGFLALENIPITATVPELLAQVEKAERTKNEEDRLVARADAAHGAEAAERIGEALALLEPLLGDVERLLGKKCQGHLFEKLKNLDPKDATGWQRRFTMGNGVGLIAEVNAVREKKDFKRGTAILAREATKSDSHLTLNQRQAVALLPFALYRTDEKRRDENIRLLDRVAAMGCETLWGTAAVGFLRRLQAPEAERYIKPPPVRQILRARRETETDKSGSAFDRLLAADLKALDGVKAADLSQLSTSRRTALVRAHILLSVGKDAFGRILGREGGRRFLDAFFRDLSWMESFAGSGPWHYGAASALDALDLLAWNEPGVYTNGFQRKAATAFSMNFPIGTNDASRVRTQERLAQQAKKVAGAAFTDEEAIVRTLQIFTELSKAGRLHDKVYGLDTYEWRYLLFPWDRNNPEDLLALNAFCNTSYNKTFRLGWKVPYRLRNCFGESVHRPEYYQPWIHAKSRYLVGTEIGGVCNMISSFAVTLGHAHGLMGVTAGQPGHCAFVVRPERGGTKQWHICYYIKPYTQGRWGVFKWGHYQNILAAEALYEGTTLADREYARWLAVLRRYQAVTGGAGKDYRAEIGDLYRIAMTKVHGNWPAGHDWQEYLRESKAPSEVWTAYADIVLETTFERLPIVCELLKPYHDILAESGNAKALDEAYEKMFRAIRLIGRAFPEMPDYRYVLNPIAKRFGKKDPQRLFRLYGTALAAHDSTDDEFFQQTLAWGAARYLSSKKWETPFLDLVQETTARMEGAATEGGKKSEAGKAMWRKQLTAAEDAGAGERRDRLLAMFRRLYPPAPLPDAPPYPSEDFGGTLISSNACVQLSKAGRFDHSERHTEFCDASPSRVDKEGPPVSAEAGKGARAGTWIRLQLGGVSEVSGILLVNAKKAKQRKGRLPLRVEISENGSDWKTVATLTQDADSWRIPLKQTGRRVKFVRAVREGDGDVALRLVKMLVYGRKLY